MQINSVDACNTIKTNATKTMMPNAIRLGGMPVFSFTNTND